MAKTGGYDESSISVLEGLECCEAENERLREMIKIAEKKMNEMARELEKEKEKKSDG